LKAIINTHGHFDHVSANKALKKASGADLMIHPDDVPMLTHLAQGAAQWGMRSEDSPAPDRLLNEGDTIKVGTLELKVFHTPGHTPGGISLYAEKRSLSVIRCLPARSGEPIFPGAISIPLSAAFITSSLPCPTTRPSTPDTWSRPPSEKRNATIRSAHCGKQCPFRNKPFVAQG
jgi:hypothetical protein